MPLRSRLPALVFACLLAALTTIGCSSSGGASGPAGSGRVGAGSTAGPDSNVPTSAGAAGSVLTVAPTTDPPGLHHFTLYWIRDCADPEHAVDIATCRIAVGETRLTDKADVPAAALDTLMLGPSDVEKLNGEQTNVRGGTKLVGLKVENGTATVSYSRFFETAKTRPQVAQVVFTLTQFPEIKKVQFLVDGTPNGAIGVAGIDRHDLNDMTPAVLMESPTLNATVGSSFKMYGNAVAAAGDSFAYKVLGPGDAPLVTSTVKVLASPGTRGPFLEPVTLPGGTAGPVTIVTSGPKGEVRTPITIG